jgi:ATP/maltotriose-dependent transcriptional regulator MalT
VSAADRSLLPGSAPPLLVGRERELALLRQHLDAAISGHGSLVLIGGEAGIGKTALAEVVCRDAAERDALVLIGRCYDLTETPPYGPWVECFGQYRQGNGRPPLPDAFAEHGTVGAVTSEAALLNAVQAFSAAVAATRPLVLLLDDLHWSDPASLDLLRFLARQIATAPILIGVTYRSDELTRRHPLYTLLPLLVREAGATRIDLKPLAADDVRTLVETRYPLPEAGVTPLVTYLIERSEGNAFFIGELLRTLEEEGVLQYAERGWMLHDLAQTRVPALLKQVIDGRLARLGEESQHLLTVAAVIGQEVPLDLWVTVAQADEDAVADTLERAVDTHILAEASGGASARFSHALIREALHESIPAIRRRRMHRRAADALAGTRNPDPDTVAYHFQQAGDDRAVEWLVKGGQRAQRSYAFVTATARYEAALALMERDGPDADERLWVSYLLATMYYYTASEKGVPTLNDVIDAATAAGNRTLAALARFQRGMLGGGSFQAKLDDMATAIGVLETLPDSSIAQIRGYLGAHYSLDADRAALGRMLANRGRFAEAQPLAEHLVGEGQDARTYPYGTGAHALMTQTAYRGDPVSARRWATAAHAALHASGMMHPLLAVMWNEMDFVHLAYAADVPEDGARLLREAEETERQESESGLGGLVAALSLGLLLLEGAWSTAKARARNLLPQWITTRTAAATWLAMLARCQGEYESAAEYVAMVLPAGALTAPGDDPYFRALQVERIAAGLALEQGDLATARQWIEAHDRWLAWSGAVLYQSEGQALWAQYHRQAGEPDQAHHDAQRALASASEPRQPLALLAAHRLLGELSTEAGEFADAATHLAASLSLADACHAPYERALTLLAMAELRAATGNRDAARTLLDEVCSICEPLGAQPALARAAALAARLDAAQETTPAYPGGLSAREVEVLRLVAQGMTNAQVAERLYLSPRTVEQHLRSIYNKLGVSTRAAATAFAYEHRLAGQ